MNHIIDNAISILVVAAIFYAIAIVFRRVTGQRLPNVIAILGKTAFIVFALYVIFIFFSEISAYEVTASELSEEFDINEQAAFAKYEGKTVSVTGVLAGSVYSSAQPWLLLGTGTRSIFTVKCFLSKAAAQESRGLEAGGQTTVRGVFSRQNGSIVLNNCALMK